MLHDILGRFPELSEASGSAQTATAVDCPKTVDMVLLSGQDIIGAPTSEKDNCFNHDFFLSFTASYSYVLLQYRYNIQSIDGCNTCSFYLFSIYRRNYD